MVENEKRSWEISRDATPEYAPQFTVYNETDGERIATVFSEEHTHLIKATPKLLDALRNLINFNEADPSLYDGDDDGTLGRLMYAATSAIADAEGRS